MNNNQPPMGLSQSASIQAPALSSSAIGIPQSATTSKKKSNNNNNIISTNSILQNTVGFNMNPSALQGVS